MSKEIKLNLDIKDLARQSVRWLRGVKRYVGISFFVLLAGLYGFVLVRITMLSTAEPSETAVSAQTSSARIPTIDSKVVEQLQSLEDNSTNVRTLFDQARQNPFQE